MSVKKIQYMNRELRKVFDYCEDLHSRGVSIKEIINALKIAEGRYLSKGAGIKLGGRKKLDPQFNKCSRTTIWRRKKEAAEK
jgi:hypothetical protein